MVDRVAVAVVLVGEPDVTVDADGGIDVLHFDGPEAFRADQQVIDLAACVSVPVEQGPVIVELLAEILGDAQLPRDAGLEDLLGVGGDRVQARADLLVSSQRDSELEPGEPFAAVARVLTLLPDPVEFAFMLGTRQRILGLTALPGRRQQVTRMIRKFDSHHRLADRRFGSHAPYGTPVRRSGDALTHVRFRQPRRCSYSH